MRIRFSLRLMMLFVLLACIVCGYESRRARQQDELATCVTAINGTFLRAPRAMYPSFLSNWIPENYRTNISTVEFGGLAAPSEARSYGYRVAFASNTIALEYVHPTEIVSTHRLRAIAELPAMRGVKTITLIGTSVNNELIEYMEGLPSAKTVAAVGTAVTLDRYKQSVTTSGGVRSTVRNGQEAVQHFHTAALQLTDDLQLFARASEGDLQSITALVQLATEDPVASSRFLDRLIVAIDSPAVDEVLRSTLTDESTSARHVAFHVLIRRFGRIDSPDQIEQEKTVAAIFGVLKDKHEPLRLSALKWFQREQVDRSYEAMLIGLQDESSTVRSFAACGIGTLANERAIEPLEKALCDEDKWVRRNAELSLERLQRR